MFRLTPMTAFAAVLLFQSCKDRPASQERQGLSSLPVDTVENVLPASTTYPPLLENAFRVGTKATVGTETVTFYGVEVGQLMLPTGRLVACDPLHADEYGTAFQQLFPAGEFPVQAAVLRIKDEEYIALSRIVFSAEPVARWEYALFPGNKPAPIAQKQDYAFGVDNSIAMYLDSTALKGFNSDKLTRWNKLINTEMNKRLRLYWRYAMVNLGSLNAAVVTTGLQDGRYTSYIGYDAQGKICRLVTDYELVDWRKK